ncbi:hypothetical protein NQ317_018800 [Molorchus minor]|uniref:Lipin N-terminal domain-containing protein n=1 Tax=Molorchus minor TaxID=1323400 RepID=A0ABQ9ITK8_9CUCU|nr:hypothetical protein NQ317_018800 [Molorchus minor]
MKLGESGEAFFVEELEDDENEIPEHLATSPIPVSEFENMFKKPGWRSFQLTDMPKLENQENDYTKRRYTDDNESNKTRERKFIQRQIILGNLEVGENSIDEMTLSMASNKLSSEDLSKSNNDISETIFKMDSLDMESSKVCHSSLGDYLCFKPQFDTFELDSNLSEPELKEMQQHTSKEKDDKTRAIDSSNIKKIDADFHFFSDTELTANGNIDSRSGTTR